MSWMQLVLSVKEATKEVSSDSEEDQDREKEARPLLLSGKGKDEGDKPEMNSPVELMLTIDDIVSVEQFNILVKLKVNPDNEFETELLEDITRDQEMKQVSIEEDIYSIGFISFIQSNSPKRLDRIVQKCVWTFVFQLLCCGLLIYNFVTEKNPGESRRFIPFGRDIYPGDPTLNMIRIVCTFLLHVSILSEVSSAKDMLSFAKKNCTCFSDQRFEYPMMFSLFKILGGFACFFCNVMLMLSSTNILDCVKDFIAVSIIAEIDNLMAQTVTSDESVTSMKLYFSKTAMRKSDIDIWNDHIAYIT